MALSTKQKDHIWDIVRRTIIWTVLVAVGLGIVVGLAVYATSLSDTR